MPVRKILLFGVAALGFAGMAATEASAEKPFFLFRPLLPGYNDRYVPPDDVYYMDEEQYYRYLKRQRRKQRILQEYYASQDEDYYDEEEYVPPRKAKKKQVSKPAVRKPAAKAVAKTRQAPVRKPANTVAAVSKPPQQTKKSETTASITKPSAGSSASISCSKAAGIVAAYGFDSVTTGTCSGSVYTFNALRAGKNYMVKVSATSGELTEVRKL